MSKLFPMFKKKGRGKEEEMEDDTKKKKRGKAGKGKEEIISSSLPSLSPSFSKSGKKKKKEKDAKQKELSFGKENLFVTDMEELHNKEFYIDDDGSVKTGPSLEVTSFDVSFEEEVIGSPRGKGSVIEGDLEIDVQIDEERVVSLNKDDSVSEESGSRLDYEDGDISRKSFDVVGGFSEDVFEASTDLFKDSNVPDEDEASTGEEILANVSESSENTDNLVNASHCEEPSPDIKQEEQEDSGISVKDLSPPELDSSCSSEKLDSKRYADMNGNPEEEATCSNIENKEFPDMENTEGTCNDTTSASACSTTKEDKSMVVISSNEETQEVSPPQRESDTDENGNSGDTVTPEVEDEHIKDDQSLLSSQDSDEDFDSAQEDWDEADSGDRKENSSEEHKSGLLDGKVDEGQSNQEIELIDQGKSPSADLFLNESVNVAMVQKIGESENVRDVQREISSGSSQYEEAYLMQENAGAVNINTVVEACNDDVTVDLKGVERKNSLTKEKLVRKLSGVSTTSSDAFNEELDELLDEELDRLSEEEEGLESEDSQSLKTCQSSLGEVLANSQDASLSEDICKAGEEDLRVETELPVDSPGGDDTAPDTPRKSIEESDIKTEVIDIDSIDKKAEICSLSPESSTSLKNSTSSPDIAKTSLLNPEEGTELVKDSGYYSLPVSPKPGVDLRENKDSVSVANKGDDSFVDSEEEGMVTPPTETALVKEDSSNQENVLDVVDDRPPQDSSAHDESTVLYQSCLESSEAEGTEKIDDITDSLNDTQGETEISKHSTNSSTSKGKNLGLHIPKDVTTDFREETSSPSLGTPTKNRLKSPIPENTPLKADSGSLTSPDPVGDRFLAVAVCQSHDEAEARLAQRRAARAEARELRLRELEKQQQDQENEEEKQFGTPAFAEAEEDEEEEDEEEEESQEPSPRAAAPTRTPLSRTGALSSAGQFSRRSSEDSTTDDSALPANVREMRTELKELDEKFRKAMITNAQLDNEKATLTFEVELMKDKYTELEETHTQLSKEHRKKCTEYEQLKKVATKLQEEVKALRSLLQERDALIQEYGLVVVGEEENGEADVPVKEEDDEFADMDDLTPRKIAVKKALLSQEAADLLSKGAAQDSLDIRLKKFGEEKKELEDQVRRLKLELEEEKNKNRRRKENGLDYDRQKEQSKTVNEYKFRVQKAEAEVSTLQANVARLDALSARYRTQSEELEKSEEELKSEKRKLQRELRELQQKYDELDSAKNFLQRQYDKMRHDRIGRF
ncbi:transcriptional regulator ATRX-like isoform X2 [Penaeus japonicus]|uniref:transcriptional regulator ATRX-like isoform X2 n=1 Tax=Penaeus japonicus TaxID=27405 RepID=UPI001C70D171|nr:transcriptional regulator ATRX-like isoform X2 [Penaeus japonicus]